MVVTHVQQDIGIGHIVFVNIVQESQGVFVPIHVTK